MTLIKIFGSAVAALALGGVVAVSVGSGTLLSLLTQATIDRKSVV